MIALRKIERSDATFIVGNWAGNVPLPGYNFPADEAEICRLIDSWLMGVHQGACFEMLVIVRDGAPVGLLSLWQREKNVSMGISVHPCHQRQGVASEAVRLAAEYAKAAGWESMISECRTDNAASVALHEKCGFERIGTRVNRKGNWVYCWKMPIQVEKQETVSIRSC